MELKLEVAEVKSLVQQKAVMETGQVQQPWRIQVYYQSPYAKEARKLLAETAQSLCTN